MVGEVYVNALVRLEILGRLEVVGDVVSRRRAAVLGAYATATSELPWKVGLEEGGLEAEL